MNSIGIIWSPARSLFHEIIGVLQNYAQVAGSGIYNLDTGVRSFVYKVYEGGNRNVLEEKICSIERCDSHEICVARLMVPERLEWDAQKLHYYNVNALELKTFVRERFQKRMQDYRYDNLFHLTVNEEEYKSADKAVGCFYELENGAF